MNTPQLKVIQKLVTYFFEISIDSKESAYKKKKIKEDVYVVYDSVRDTWKWGVPQPSQKLLDALETTSEDLFEYIIQQIIATWQTKMF